MIRPALAKQTATEVMMTEATKTVDSYRFLAGISKRMIKSWVALDTPHAIPWTPLTKPLAECTVALISSAALARVDDAPFDQAIEQQNPWFSDPSYRVIPVTTETADVRSYHLHVNVDLIQQDLNCALPLAHLRDLEARGVIGRAAPSHYSFGGYTCLPERLLNESVPAIIRQLEAEAVDVVALAPI